MAIPLSDRYTTLRQQYHCQVEIPLSASNATISSNTTVSQKYDGQVAIPLSVRSITVRQQYLYQQQYNCQLAIPLSVRSITLSQQYLYQQQYNCQLAIPLSVRSITLSQQYLYQQQYHCQLAIPLSVSQKYDCQVAIAQSSVNQFYTVFHKNGDSSPIREIYVILYVQQTFRLPSTNVLRQKKTTCGANGPVVYRYDYLTSDASLSKSTLTEERQWKMFYGIGSQRTQPIVFYVLCFNTNGINFQQLFKKIISIIIINIQLKLVIRSNELGVNYFINCFILLCFTNKIDETGINQSNQDLKTDQRPIH